MTYHSTSETETRAIAKEIAAALHGSQIIALIGDLGAGKTTFVKGLAEAFGITKEIVSPTFTIMNIYNLTPNTYNLKTLVHVDTYRLENEQELIDIGIEDYLGVSGTLCVIEWPEKISGLLNSKKVVEIRIEHAGDNKRTVTVTDNR